jgi:hypothetical protein
LLRAGESVGEGVAHGDKCNARDTALREKMGLSEIPWVREGEFAA